jgi:hypothetical protein
MIGLPHESNEFLNIFFFAKLGHIFTRDTEVSCANIPFADAQILLFGAPYIRPSAREIPNPFLIFLSHCTWLFGMFFGKSHSHRSRVAHLY